MTKLREQAIEMVKDMTEDKVIYVWNILKNMKDLSEQSKQDEKFSDKKLAL